MAGEVLQVRGVVVGKVDPCFGKGGWTVVVAGSDGLRDICLLSFVIKKRESH
jgi:hypothetical protein